MGRKLLLHWAKNHFTLADFSRNKKGLWTLQATVTHHYSHKNDRDELYQEAETLRQLQIILRSWKVLQADLHCFLPSESVFLQSRSLEIAPGLQDIIPRLIVLEAKKVFLLPLEELIWDYHIFPSSRGEKINVVYYATKKTSIRPLVDILSQINLRIETLSSTPHALMEAMGPILVHLSSQLPRNHGHQAPAFKQVIDLQETKIIIDLSMSFTNIILTKPNEIVSSYTLHERGENRSSLEKIHIALIHILDHMAVDQKMIAHEIFLTGVSNYKKELISFLRERLTINTHDIDQKLSITPACTSFLKHELASSLSLLFLMGATRFFEKKNIIHVHLLTPLLRAKKHVEQQRPYVLAAMGLIISTLLLWSFYFQHETRRLMTATAQAAVLLADEEKQLLSLKQAEAHFQNIEEKKWALYTLIEAHVAWPHLLSELQKALPKLPRQKLWITKLSSLSDEKNNKKSASITALEIEGITLTLENGSELDAVNEFHEFTTELSKSDLFNIIPQEKIALLPYPTHQNSSTYTWKLRLPLRDPIKYSF